MCSNCHSQSEDLFKSISTNYNKIRKMDISNGPGVRVSIFMQGCEAKCEECFNPETWPFENGEKFTQETINTILDLCNKDQIAGLSILGGEPLHILNYRATEELMKQFKEKFPNKTIWVWTGFIFETLKEYDYMKYIDVLVDGRFILKQKDIRLKYCGSSNQRVIDVQRSLKEGETILWEKR